MFESIILVGPSSNLFPLVNKSLNITNLPVLNTELLLLNLRFLQPISKKIYIIILKQDIHHLSSVLLNFDIPVEIVGIDLYDGSIQELYKLKDNIKSDNIIVTKGDLVTNIDINTISNEYIEKKSSFLTILSSGYNEAICGISNDELIYYNRSDNYVIPNDIFINYKITISKESDTVHFFMFKKSLLQYVTREMFSFKSNFFPFIVEKLRVISPIKIYNPMDNYIYQIRNITSYIETLKALKFKTHTSTENLICSEDMSSVMKHYIKKNKLKEIKNIIGLNLIIGSGFIVNSILGNNVSLQKNIKIMSSILMNNIFIGDDCFIEDCVIGSNVKIPSNTKLVKCTVSPFYVFDKSVNLEMTILNNKNL